MNTAESNNLEYCPKTAIIGTTGLLGKAFYEHYQKIGADCVGTTHSKLLGNEQYFNLEAPNIAPLRLKKQGYSQALILAGITKIAQCELEREKTWEINVKGTLELIRQLTEEDIVPIFFSSDYVFDGQQGYYTDDALVNPCTEYGKQKAEVEKSIIEISQGSCLVVRLSKVFTLDKGDNTLLDEMCRQLMTNKPIKAAYDQIFSPILLFDVIKIVVELQTKGLLGIFNLCSAETWSRYDIAMTLAKSLNVNTTLIQRISLDELRENFKRPKNTSMKSVRLQRKLKTVFTPITDCINKISLSYRITN